jgi:hypothetical protein
MVLVYTLVHYTLGNMREDRLLVSSMALKFLRGHVTPVRAKYTLIHEARVINIVSILDGKIKTTWFAVFQHNRMQA